jgi:hypothetical protein
MKKIYLLILLIISGALSTYAPFFLPGMIFGIVFGLYIGFMEKINFKKIVLWMFLSWLAYFLAFYTAVILYRFDSLGLTGFISAGIVGSAILVFSTKLLIKTINTKQIIATIATGGISSVSFILSILAGVPNIGAFIVWQVAVGLVLYGAIQSKNMNLDIDLR